MEIKHLLFKRELAKKSNMTFHNMMRMDMIMNMNTIIHCIFNIITF